MTEIESRTDPRVTIVMPIRNEADFIERSLGAVLSQDYPPSLVQVLVVDGMSSDGTREMLERAGQASGNGRVLALDNPARTVPSALNIGLAHASGDVIIRVDGHCEIPREYVRRCVDLLRSTGADCVGGAIVTVGRTRTARAIAIAQSSAFGVGGVAFRTGRGSGGYVDTLAFGAYRREVFDRIGGFDEELVRNQDDELNFRLLQSGGKIWLDPSLRTEYYSRGTFASLWRQYFQYGRYKVRVIRKRRAVAALRHLAPAAFVVLLFASFLTAAWFRDWRLGLLVLGPYAAANLGASLVAARRELFLLPRVSLAFLILHFAYGLGFLRGLIDWAAGVR